MRSRLYSPARRKNRERGFTLIELLIVVIIISILAAIALPIYLNSQKSAVDASVQSDVRNTVDKVAEWQVANQNTAEASTAAYTSAGGTVTQTPNNTLSLKVNSDGSYTVCGYSTNGKQYTSNASAYLYDSTTGRFGLTTTGCAGDSGTTAPAITTAAGALPAATQNVTYSTTITATGSPSPSFSATGLPAGLSMSNAGVISGKATATGNSTIVVTATNGGGSDTKTYTLNVKSATPVTVYSENFAGSSVPSGYTAGGNCYQMQRVSDPGLLVSYCVNYNTGINTPSVALTAGTTYKFSGTYTAAGGNGTRCSLQVVGTGASSASTSGDCSYSYAPMTVTFTVPTSGNYSMSFTGYVTGNTYASSELQNVSIVTVP